MRRSGFSVPSGFLVPAVLCLALVGLLLPTEAAAAVGDAASPAPHERDKLSSRLLVVHNRVLGEITVVFGPKGEPAVPKGALLDMLLPLLDADPQLQARVKSAREWDGKVSLAAIESAGFVVELDASRLRLSRSTVVISTTPTPAPREERVQQPRSSTLDLTVTSGKKELGVITAQVTGSSSVRLPKAALIDMLSPAFDNSALAAIENIPDVRGYIDLTSLSRTGFATRIDAKRLDITRAVAALAPLS